MEVINLLKFLNKIKSISTPDFVTCSDVFADFLELMNADEQFTQKIDLGVIYTEIKTLDNYIIIDGLSRILSLSLLLHAVCECYKETTSKNEAAIATIRKKYLLCGDHTKLRLPMDYQVIYEKIIFGERLSGKEKRHPIFKLLHSYWSQIKEQELHASHIFNILHKVYVTIIETENVNTRNLYYSLNKNRNINNIKLVNSFAEQEEIVEAWERIKKIYSDNESDILLFFANFFRNKFNYKTFEERKFYEYFTNYFETMKKYQSAEEIVSDIEKNAKLFSQLINIDVKNESIKKELIQIKMFNGEDTYPYLLSVYGDYVDGTLNEASFLEILSTINDYLKNRRKSDNNVDFNELIKYLNAFLACK